MKNMELSTAKQSVDLLLIDKKPGDKVQLTFLGGEPLINRDTLRETVVYAATLAKEKGIIIQFSITSNGTLITQADAVFFEEYGFAVTISLDGVGEAHDRLRPIKNGNGSYDRIINNVQYLLEIQKKMQVSVRATVTPKNMDLARSLEAFIQMGFHSVGFSPLLRSSNGQDEMTKEDLEQLLVGMVECGLLFEQNALQGKRFPFLNIVNSIKEISKGTHRPYPCGAGAGYMGVSAEGNLAACHRFVNDADGDMGDIFSGIDSQAQNTWLAERHVHNQTPCNSCWARYLCGGGCHHEVLAKGRNACDFIRGWLYYSIQAYSRMQVLVPEHFQ